MYNTIYTKNRVLSMVNCNLRCYRPSRDLTKISIVDLENKSRIENRRETIAAISADRIFCERQHIRNINVIFPSIKVHILARKRIVFIPIVFMCLYYSYSVQNLRLARLTLTYACNKNTKNIYTHGFLFEIILRYSGTFLK